MNGLPTDADAFFAEPEGRTVPADLSVVDAHVHLFPPGLFEAIWRWFDRHAWKIRYRLHAEQVVEFLLARGVKRLVALHYAHKPGMARELNRFVAEIAAAHPEVIPLATVFPGEPDARDVLREAFGPLSLRGVKIHCHVQKLGADDARLDEVYVACEAAGLPVVIHAGREPSSEAYGVDTRALCAADQIDRVLSRHPRLRLVVPHLGADEFEAYGRLLDRHEHLWLDTTMSVAGYFAVDPPASVFPARAARLLYGTDFPNIPYAWDRELKRIAGAGLSPELLRGVLAGNALALFGG
jgi:predicted TIM-barrel fold metal-dependent hydrolase